MNLLLIITLINSGLIAAVWYITNPRTLKETIFQDADLKRRLLVAVQIIIIFIQIASSYYKQWSIPPFDTEIIFTGIGIQIIGALIAIWSKLSMGKNWGQPAQHDIQRQKDLVTGGIYSFSRNPIYVGLVLVDLGISLTFRSYFIFLILFLIYVIYRSVLVEETLLTKHFGKKYTDYKRKVRRFI